VSSRFGFFAAEILLDYAEAPTFFCEVLPFFPSTGILSFSGLCDPPPPFLAKTISLASSPLPFFLPQDHVTLPPLLAFDFLSLFLSPSGVWVVGSQPSTALPR